MSSDVFVNFYIITDLSIFKVLVLIFLTFGYILNEKLVPDNSGVGMLMSASEAITITENFGCPADDASSGWVPGLGSAPDVPHTELSGRKAEGSGVGVQKEPPVRNFSEFDRSTMGTMVSCSQMAQKLMSDARSLCFVVADKTGLQDAVWDSVLIGGALLVDVPLNVKPEGSRESFMMLIEYAENILKCSRVVACFKKNRSDRNILIRALMHFGFSLVSPPSSMPTPATTSVSNNINNNADMMYMSCAFDEDDDEEDDDVDDDDDDDGDDSNVVVGQSDDD
ncbi:hypothetical protein HELRODRAFT_189969 [Helobdella robusta]|uniref:Ornithine decarboxylase antizyme n=1 Tax=Helobdella robusta TaxID=6412 RepID=T1FRJ6_HELRO|nr:hypothetical protein HELRODRAFT_189969 [Helobdella robusta]ESN90744.1 hypothetical protein HELRODRAFT_189969 [Helobdella robusta]